MVTFSHYVAFTSKCICSCKSEVHIFISMRHSWCMSEQLSVRTCKTVVCALVYCQCAFPVAQKCLKNKGKKNPKQITACSSCFWSQILSQSNLPSGSVACLVIQHNLTVVIALPCTDSQTAYEPNFHPCNGAKTVNAEVCILQFC